METSTVVFLVCLIHSDNWMDLFAIMLVLHLFERKIIKIVETY